MGTTWQWLEFQDSASGAEANNIGVDTPQNYTISFLPDGQLGIRADCNVGGGTYTKDGSSLTIQLGVTTLVACPDDSLDQEFRTRLEQVATFVQDGDNLVLNLALDSGNMVFAPLNELVGTTWQWVEFQDRASGAEANNISVPNPENYTIAFLPDGELALRFDCNRGTGTYTLDGSSLTIQLGITTLAACPDDSLDQEFRTRLEQVATFVQDGDNLVLNLALDSGNMVFAPLNELVGTTWQWVEFQDRASGAEANNISVPNPENYTISFNAEGELTYRADCNVGGGTYTVAGNRLTIQLGISTLVACPEDSLDQEFRTRLEQVATFVTAGDNLVLNLALDSGNMIFQPE